MADTMIPNGVFPTMITPFTPDGSSVDWDRLDVMVDWYIERGCTGLFAVCQSSEMYNMIPSERLEVARRVVNRAAGRVPVVACGTFGISEGRKAFHSLDDTASFIVEMGKIVAAVVVIVSQMCEEVDDDMVWKENVQKLLEKSNDVPLGLVSGLPISISYPHSLLCKVFLQHLNALLTLDGFTGIWLDLLGYMQKLTAIKDCELLADAVIEALKNMVRVMSTAGIFKPPSSSYGFLQSGSSSNSNTLWNLTWGRIDGFLPTLKGELFPEYTSEPVSALVVPSLHSDEGDIDQGSHISALVVPSLLPDAENISQDDDSHAIVV